MTRTQAIDMGKRLEEKHKLIGTRIAIMRDEADVVSRGGIIIPDEAKRKPLSGRIVMLGKGMVTNAEDVPVDGRPVDFAFVGLEVGDHCTFSKYNGVLHEVVLDGGEKVVIECFHANDIYVVSK